MDQPTDPSSHPPGFGGETLTAAAELAERARALVAAAGDVAERYERLEWALAGQDPVGAVGDQADEQVQEAMWVAAAAIAASRLRLRDAYADVPFPGPVGDLLGGDVMPEYARLLAQEQERVQSLLVMGRAIEREARGEG